MPPLLRPAISIVVFLTALFGTAAMLRRIDPFAAIPFVKEKWDHYRAHRDEFDTIFIGTSRTYRGIMPSLFDELTAAGGEPTRSLNLAIDGMHAPEDAFFAASILADPPPHLRWVFLEIGTFAEGFGDRDPHSVRSVYWHDWQRTQLCIRALLWPKMRKTKWKSWFKHDAGEPSPASIAATHLSLFAARSLNLGRASTAWTRIALMRRGAAQPEYLGPREDGFLPILGSGAMPASEVAEFRTRLASRQREVAKIVPANLYTAESLLRTAARVRAVGAQPIALLAPTLADSRGHPPAESGVPVFDFCDVAAFPELFTEDVRTDPAHVNAKGAALYTRRLAEKFLTHTRSQPPR